MNKDNMIMALACIVIIVCILRVRESDAIIDTWLGAPGITGKINIGKTSLTPQEQCREQAKANDRNSYLFKTANHTKAPNTCTVSNLNNYSTTKKNENKPGHYFACTNDKYTLNNNCQASPPQ